MKYRLKVKMGSKWVTGITVHDTLEEAMNKKDELIALGKKAGKRTTIKIVDEFGAPLK